MDVEYSLREMRRALEGSRNSAPGQDQVCYVMFKQPAEDALKVIFNLSNKIWITRNMETALILPFVKPGKDSSDAKACRPIALTSRLCKWMRKMVVYRLEYVVGNNKLLNEYQSGFRRGRSQHSVRKDSVKGNTKRNEYRWRKIQYQAPSVDFIACVEEGTEDRCDWTPYMYFKQFATDEMLQETAEQTNLCRVQKEGKSVNTTAKEIEQVLGMYMHMGLVGLSFVRV